MFGKEKKTKIDKIESFEKVTLKISGMRHTSEYEAVMSDGMAELSEYSEVYSNSKDARKLERRAVFAPEIFVSLMNDCRFASWDGFSGVNSRVLDGYMFTLTATVNGGGRIYAHGSNKSPNGYSEFVEGMNRLLDEYRAEEYDEPYQDVNAKVIDRWIEEGWEWGQPISHEEYQKVKRGVWNVGLTPTKYVPHRWFGELSGKKLLGLASGGGQQIPVFAALGAECTVLDYSERQIQSEIDVAKREGYEVETVRADMTKPLPFEDETFDMIFHPVSNSYIKEVEPVWRECFRVLKPGGVLIAGLDNGINFLFDGEDERYVVNSLPFDPILNSEHMRQLKECDGGIQFSHTLDEQIGGQLRAGFRLTDLYEDTNGEGRLHDMNIPSFVATRAVKEEVR